MRKVVTISSAVAAILAAGTAGAANVDVYISGASAQKNFWYQDLANIANCPVTSLVGAKWNGPATAPFTKAADMSFVQCTAGAAPLNSNITPGSTVTFHYSAELGSVWGVANMLGMSGVSGYPSTHIFLTPNGGCTAGAYTAANASFAATCGNSSSPPYALYTSGLGANTGTDQFAGITSNGSTTMFLATTPDIAVADLEPAKFHFPYNWANANPTCTTSPCYAAIGKAPSSSQLNNIGTNSSNTFNGQMNGELFAVIVNSVGTPFAGTPVNNLSSNSVAAILQGDYTTWNQVPEVGPKDSGTAITVCRRDHGSGSQVAASIFFTGTECGAFNDGGVLSTGVSYAGSTSAMRSCVNATAGAIGYLSVYGNLPGQNESDNYAIVNIDGVQANAHNAAAGYYRYATQTWAYTNDPSTSVANTMITRAEAATDIQQVEGGETVTLGSNGQFTLTTANTEIGQYEITGLVGSDEGSAAAIDNVSTASVPISLRSNSGESCTVMAGQNGP
jgi:hypothetical protein